MQFNSYTWLKNLFIKIFLNEYLYKYQFYYLNYKIIFVKILIIDLTVPSNVLSLLSIDTEFVFDTKITTIITWSEVNSPLSVDIAC